MSRDGVMEYSEACVFVCEFDRRNCFNISDTQPISLDVLSLRQKRVARLWTISNWSMRIWV